MMNRDSITEMLTEKLLQGETLKWARREMSLAELLRDDPWFDTYRFVMWFRNASSSEEMLDKQRAIDPQLKALAESWLKSFEGQVCITYHENREIDYEEDDALSLLGDPMRMEKLAVRR